MTVHDAGDAVLSDVAVADRTVLRCLVLLGTPLALAILEFFHPEQPSGASGAVEQGVWFMWFHFIQVPLIGLIAVAVYLLTEGLEGRTVSVSRWAVGVFAVFFSAYDAAAGMPRASHCVTRKDSRRKHKPPSTRRSRTCRS